MYSLAKVFSVSLGIRAEYYPLVSTHLKNFATVQYKVLIVLSVEEQVVDIDFTCPVEKSVECMHAYTFLGEIYG